MKVVVAGGSGFVGRGLCKLLAQEGHEAVVLTREPRPRPGGPREVAWDAASSGPWQDALDGADAVVNLAGASIAQGRWTPARKKILRDSRLLSTRALVAGLSGVRARPKVLVSASAVGYYGDRGEEPVDESAKPGEGFLAGLCADWEREAQVAEPLGVRVVRLRFGVVLGRGGGALAKMLPAFKLGLGGPIGGGRQWFPWITRSDATGLILRCAQDPKASGPVNAVAPQAARNAEFAAALGRVLRRPALLRAPAFALKLALGEMSEMLLTGQRVEPKKALELGYSFRHPELEAGLRAEIER